MSFMKKDSYFLYIPISVETFGYGIYWLFLIDGDDYLLVFGIRNNREVGG